MRLKKLSFVALVCWIGTAGFAPAQEAALHRGAETLSRAVEESLAQAGSNVDVTLWVGSPTGRLFERGAATVMPTASAIKTFYLVELFTRNEVQLDEPVPDARQILTDDHPSISHFAGEVRDEIRRELAGATVRRVGEVMMGKTNVSNAVYNAAANLVTAHLGGPEKLTALIHARDPRFKSVIVRRYMLRDRTQPGDNEATAESFAALYQSLASRRLNGISDSVMTALHEVLKRQPADEEPLYEKDGGLGTDPLTAVKAGWKQTNQGPLVFVVMCRQSATDPSRRTEAYQDLRKLSLTLRDRAVSAARGALRDSSSPIEHTSDSLETVRSNLDDQKGVLLDVRDRDEWDEGHLADAKLIPLGQLRKPDLIGELLQAVPKDRIVYLHCAAGGRALNAGRILREQGYDARPLSAGYDELLKNGFEKAK